MLSSLLIFSGLAATGLSVCPDLPSLKVFDTPQYTGHWYEIQRYPLVAEVGETCAQANYTLQADGSIRLENCGKKADGNIDCIKGSATADDPSQPASLTLLFDEGFSGTYNVIRTDYSSSALVYSCNDLFGFKLEYAWFLSRTDQMDQAVLDEYKQILADAGSDISQLIATPQDCGSLF